MNADPPPDVRRALATVAAELGLRKPRLTPLPGGSANRAWRLRAAEFDLVLRVAGAPAAALGADARSEHAMQALAAAAGLAPEILLARPEEGLLVTRHVAGDGLTRQGMRDPALLRRVGRWIAGMQALPAPRDLPRVDFGARAAGYLESLHRRRPSPRVDELLRRLSGRRAALPAASPVSCHHDLHHRNIVATGDRLLVLDWEYAGPGDPAADLAACIGYHALGPREVAALHEGHGGCDATLAARVAALGWIFDCLWFGWNAAAELEGLPPEPGLQERLAARLLA